MSTVTVLQISSKTQNRPQTWLYPWKANETYIPTIYCVYMKYCQLFMHETNTFLLKQICHLNQLKPPNSPFPWGMWTPSSKPIPPLTTPNDSSISSRTSTQLCNKVPTAYNGMPQIHAQNCSYPFDNYHSNSIHPSFNWPYSLSQKASGSNQPFCRSSLSDQTDRQTDRLTDEIDNSSIPCVLTLAILIESNALITIQYLYSALKSYKGYSGA